MDYFRWDVSIQEIGITDIMRCEIIGFLQDTVETHGINKIDNICKDIFEFLNIKYGDYWTIVIGDEDRIQIWWHIYESLLFRVTDKRTGLTFRMAKTAKLEQ